MTGMEVRVFSHMALAGPGLASIWTRCIALLQLVWKCTLDILVQLLYVIARGGSVLDMDERSGYGVEQQVSNVRRVESAG